jgi:UDP-N-acetylmuramoyl-L-alanyl-D-glutamate--2,6-diaminopimelate ligase
MFNIKSLLSEYSICGLADDSRKVKPGYMFFAIPGVLHNGEQFVEMAIENGAAVVVTQNTSICARDGGAHIVHVQDVNKARVQAAQEYYNHPQKAIRIHGVTGTNGKTTISYLLEQILQAAGYKTALVGTIVQRIDGVTTPSSLTTPGVLELYSLLSNAVLAKCTEFVMEVSSHAIDQGRINGLQFSTALFTNLTQDHLDYHHTMENYFAAKSKLFTEYLLDDGKYSGKAIINLDSEYGKKLVAILPQSVVRSASGQDKTATYYVNEYGYGQDGLQLNISHNGIRTLYKTHLWGGFNTENAMLAIAAANEMGIPSEKINQGLQRAQVPGRFEMVVHQQFRKIIVDYAHTPDALLRVLQAGRSICTNRLLCVFGCGGDRDKTKRPIMGRMVQENADVAILTSDNPRSENPQSILDDTLQGMDAPKVVITIDRKLAIEQACAMMQEGDVLIIAGKGHENYQILATGTIHFDDKEVAKEAVGALVWN